MRLVFDADAPTPEPSPYFPLHRPEIADSLHEGESLLRAIAGRQVSLPARRLVSAAGEEAATVYRIRSGWCARVRYLRDGRTQTTALMLPGDLVGVSAVFAGRQLDDVVAITEAELDGIDQAALREEASASWPLTLRLTYHILEEDRRLRNWLIANSRGSADERLALLLSDIRGRLILLGQADAGAATIPWPLTQAEMAEILGLTAVHVNRTLRKLRALGVAAISGRTASVDPVALARLAQPLLDLFERSSPAFVPSAQHRSGGA